MPLFLSVSNKITVYSLITPQGLFAFSTKQHHIQIKLLLISVIISLAYLVCKHYFYAEVVVYRRESRSYTNLIKVRLTPPGLSVGIICISILETRKA